MYLYQLLSQVKFDDIWPILKEHYDDCWEIDRLKTDDFDRALHRSFRSAFTELQNLRPANLSDGQLVVIKLYDECHADQYRYDVVKILPGKNDRFDVSILPWNEWLSLKIHQKSLDMLTPEQFIAHALYYITLHGFSEEASAQSVKNCLEELHRRIQQIDCDEQKLIPAEDVFREFKEKYGIIADELSPEEKKQRRKQLISLTQKNEDLYNSLLAEDGIHISFR